MKKLIQLLTARPLTAVVCLLVIMITAVSSLNYVAQDFSPANSHICQGWIDSPSVTNEEGRTKLTVQLQGCKEGSELKPVTGRIQLTVNDVCRGEAQPPPEMHEICGRPHLPANGLVAGRAAPTYGSIIRFQTRLHGPSDFKNPGGFKYRRFLRSRGITAIGFIGDPKWIVRIGEVDGHYLRKTIEGWRLRIADSLEATKDADIRSVARALLIGDGSRIGEDIKEDFRRSGLAHILVISGFNVAFVALAVFFAFKWLLLLVPNLALRFNIFKPAAALTIAAVWLYAYLTGAEVSVVRAAIMATVYLAGMVLDERQDIFTSLALAALIIIAASPLAIFDISFQLSFVAVISLAVIYPWITGHFKWMSPGPNETIFMRARRYLGETVAASVAATVGVAPLIAYYFHYSSMAGIIANIIVVPWAGFVLTPISLIISFLGIIDPSIAAIPVQFFGWLIEPMLFMAHKAAQISAPLTIALTPPKMFIVLFYILIFGVATFRLRQFPFGVAAFRLRNLRNLKVATPIFLIAICLVLMFISLGLQRGWFSKDRLEVTFLDVGQGSSTVVKFPDGRVMVVDGGGFMNSDFDIGKFVIAPYLWNRGISKIDWLVLTHAHPDHFKGLGFLAEEFSPKALLWNGVPPSPFPSPVLVRQRVSGGMGEGGGEKEDTGDWDEFVERIKKANVPMVDVSENLVRPEPVEGRRDLLILRQAQDERVQFLSPPSRIPSDWNLNDTSLIMLITHGDISFLLTGDIGSAAETSFMESPSFVVSLSNHERSGRTVLQVPHHGSATSSTKEFLEMVRPEYAVIQLGENNRYKFPNQGVLERLKQVGAKIFRTDKDGAVEFRTDGNKLGVAGFSPR